ncbi:pentapeptide repeat-containing protein [Streptomyces xantholiticus]|uniref:pentapeptide repeat-containing protein n=1 Tax=Streptomyces xantholiticus TaxID=68285 RepID=UPI001E5131B4|nr:pentapeptide repeat-containing protein [Streptomyces xantholiticus]
MWHSARRGRGTGDRVHRGREANLRKADAAGAVFRRADLRLSDPRGADLSRGRRPSGVILRSAGSRTSASARTPGVVAPSKGSRRTSRVRRRRTPVACWIGRESAKALSRLPTRAAWAVAGLRPSRA